MTKSEVVIPAEAGIQDFMPRAALWIWIPAFAGMTFGVVPLHLTAYH